MVLTRERLEGGHHVTDFDSSVNTVRAVAGFLRGESHGGFSMGPASRTLARALASPPARLRAAMYRAAGFSQGIPLHQVRDVDVDLIDQWACQQYGPGPFPAVVIGSTSGAAVHLAAALGAPFLPQTTLVALRDLATHPDDPRGAMATLAPMTRLLARRNPRVAVYHMHDPAQDRPMVEAMAYMRLKRRRLGRAYEQFLQDRLAPGGTIVQVENTRTWGSSAVGERAYFQFGCLGGLSEEEYHHGSDRIARYLEQEDAPVRSWDPPEPDGQRAEAEWGSEPAFAEDLARFAQSRGLPVRRLASCEPQQQSAFCADLYRWWYARLGRPTDRLLVKSYAQWDPYWALRTGSVPFWMRFNMEPDLATLEAYLKRTEPFAHIHLNLFSQGIQSPGVVPVEAWQALLDRHAQQTGEIIGVDTTSYPLDAGSGLRYEPAFGDIPAREPFPPPLAVDDVDRFVATGEHRWSGAEWR